MPLGDQFLGLSVKMFPERFKVKGSTQVWAAPSMDWGPRCPRKETVRWEPAFLSHPCLTPPPPWAKINLPLVAFHKDFIIILRIWVLFPSTSVYMHLCYPQGPEEGVGVSFYWSYSCELPCGCWGLNLGLLEEQSVLITTECIPPAPPYIASVRCFVIARRKVTNEVYNTKCSSRWQQVSSARCKLRWIKILKRRYPRWIINKAQSFAVLS